jgi:hypothetical protein
MPSTYTLNNGIELIGTGEQSGTWGDTTNTNLGLLDAALDGQVTITLAAAGSSGSPNALPITDGTTSNGRNRMVVFADGGDLGATAYVQLTPNDAEKIIYIRNSLSGSRSVILFQGTYNASNDYEVPAGTTAIVYFDGAGAGAVAANVFNNAYFDGLRLGNVSVTAILDEDNMASDSATALATQQSIKAYVDAQVGTVDTLAEILAIGNTTGATDIAVDSAQKVQFRDAAIYINSSVDGQLDIVADTEIQIAATTVDVNGALDVSGTALVTGVLTTTAATVFNGGFAAGGVGTFADGSNSAPSLTNTGDLNTGLYFPAADEVGLTVGGTQRLNVSATGIDVTGNVELSANNSLILNAASTAHTNRINWDYDGTTYAHIGRENATGDMQFTVQSVERMRINSSGGLITNPAAGGHAVFNEGGIDADFRVESDTDANALFVEGSSGNVGIGIGSPSAVLHLKNTIGSALTLLKFETGWDNPSGNKSIEWTDATNTLGRISVDYTSPKASMRFGSLYNSGYQTGDVMTLIADGNVGIGSSTANHFSITGTANVLGVKSSSGALVSIAATGTNFSGIDLGTDSLRRAGVYSLNGSVLGFYTNPTNSGSGMTERMSINSSGGLITTPAAGGHAVFNEGGADADFRVESDNNANMLFLDASVDRISMGTSDSNDSTLTIRSTNNNFAMVQESAATIPSGGIRARMFEGTYAINGNSSNSVLSIPITSQGGLWVQYQVELSVVTGEYNINGYAKGGSCIFSFTSLTTLDALVEQQVTGNISSVTLDSANMEVDINFSSAYTAGQSGWEGVLVHAKVFSYGGLYFEMDNATLN